MPCSRGDEPSHHLYGIALHVRVKVDVHLMQDRVDHAPNHHRLVGQHHRETDAIADADGHSFGERVIRRNDRADIAVDRGHDAQIRVVRQQERQAQIAFAGFDGGDDLVSVIARER